jgi:hypothetical protein
VPSGHPSLLSTHPRLRVRPRLAKLKMASLGDDLLNTVNKLQDLVFNTIGSDSLDLPQIVCFTLYT